MTIGEYQTGGEIQNDIKEVKAALDGIVKCAERFVSENIMDGVLGISSGWDDVCGRKIGDMIVSSVASAVSDHIRHYENDIDGLECNLVEAVEAIERARKAVQ